MKPVGIDMSKLVLALKPSELYRSDANKVVPPLGICADNIKRTYIQVCSSH
jgi:hypothetical protein